MASQKIFIEKSSNKGSGKLVPAKKAKISVFDTGLQRSYGVFETLRTYNGEVFQLSSHLERLLYSVEGIGIEMSWSKKDLAKRIKATFEKSGLEVSTIKVIITGGKEQGLMEGSDPVLIIICSELHTYPDQFYKKGVKVITFQGRRFLPRIKSLSYLEGYLAVEQAREMQAHEALYCTEEGEVLEGTTSNFFIVDDKKIITPKEDILRGITRDFVLKIVEDSKLDVEERPLSLQETYKADEAFLTSTSREILPVTKINHQEISKGEPGKITQALAKKFQKEVKKRT